MSIFVYFEHEKTAPKGCLFEEFSYENVIYIKEIVSKE